MLALLLAGCLDRTPENDPNWNAEDLESAIFNTDADSVVDIDESGDDYYNRYLNGEYRYHEWYRYDYYLDYDLTRTERGEDLDLSDDRMRLTSARFTDHYDDDYWEEGDWYGPYEWDRDQDWYSSMSFAFETPEGYHCEMLMERSGWLFDPDTDWRLRYHESKPNRGDPYNCYDLLHPVEATESIADILRPHL